MVVSVRKKIRWSIGLMMTVGALVKTEVREGLSADVKSEPSFL